MPAVPDPGDERLFAGTLRILGTEVAVTYALTRRDPDRDPARWTIAGRASPPWLGGFDAPIDLVPDTTISPSSSSSGQPGALPVSSPGSSGH
jgi:hypothetical protein